MKKYKFVVGGVICEIDECLLNAIYYLQNKKTAVHGEANRPFAIKTLRVFLTGMGLREAKELVELIWTKFKESDGELIFSDPSVKPYASFVEVVSI